MADAAFDTLEASRRLQTAGIEAEQADAIVEVVNQSAGQMVTVERFEAGLAALHARIDSVRSEWLARMDAIRSQLQAEIFRSLLIAVGISIAANALMLTLLGSVLSRGAI